LSGIDEKGKVSRELKITKKATTPKVKIVKEVFLGEFKIEDFLQKKVDLLLEKYKNN
jgi:hypothetical protein